MSSQDWISTELVLTASGCVVTPTLCFNDIISNFIIMTRRTPVLLLTLISLARALNVDEKIKPAPSVRFSPEAEHRQLLENVIEFGLNRSSHLVHVQEKELYDRGMVLNESQPGHFVSVFNKQDKKSKRMSTFAYATLQASSLLSKQ